MSKWARFGTKILQEFGATHVGEGEHGFQNAIVTGNLHSHTVQLLVYDLPGEDLPNSVLVARRAIAGQEVEVNRVRQHFYGAFKCAGFALQLSLFDDTSGIYEGATQVLEIVEKALGTATCTT